MSRFTFIVFIFCLPIFGMGCKSAPNSNDTKHPDPTFKSTINNTAWNTADVELSYDEVDSILFINPKRYPKTDKLNEFEFYIQPYRGVGQYEIAFNANKVIYWSNEHLFTARSGHLNIDYEDGQTLAGRFEMDLVDTAHLVLWVRDGNFNLIRK